MVYAPVPGMPENNEHQFLRAGKMGISAQAESKFALHLPFWSIQALNRWQEACLYW